MSKKNGKIKILVVNPHEYPVVQEVDDALETYQELVGGYIQVLYPWKDKVGLVCNDEGKIMGLEANRELTTEDGQVYDIIAGTFFICGLGNDDFKSLTDEQIKKYTEMFREPLNNNSAPGMN